LESSFCNNLLTLPRYDASAIAKLKADGAFG
jgi:hypothetical protein